MHAFEYSRIRIRYKINPNRKSTLKKYSKITICIYRYKGSEQSD